MNKSLFSAFERLTFLQLFIFCKSRIFFLTFFTKGSSQVIFIFTLPSFVKIEALNLTLGSLHTTNIAEAISNFPSTTPRKDNEHVWKSMCNYQQVEIIFFRERTSFSLNYTIFQCFFLLSCESTHSCELSHVWDSLKFIFFLRCVLCALSSVQWKILFWFSSINRIDLTYQRLLSYHFLMYSWLKNSTSNFLQLGRIFFFSSQKFTCCY